MTSKEQERFKRSKVSFSLRATAKQSQVDHDLEKPKAEQMLGETPVSSTWKSSDGQLGLTAQAIYNDPKYIDNN